MRWFSSSTSPSLDTSKPSHYSGDTIDHTVNGLTSTTPYTKPTTTASQTGSTTNPHNHSVLNSEVLKFSAMAVDWWNPTGSVGPLHDMNPLRVDYIAQHVLQSHSKAVADDGTPIDRPVHLPLLGYNILDVGCGGGLLVESLARLGATVTGVDATAAAVTIAKQHIALDTSVRDRVTYQCITAEELVDQGKQYDIVCALEIVEHVNGQAEFVNTIKQLVKPSGALFMSTLNKTYASYLLAIVGAEYVLRLVARGTHDWNMFVEPAQLAQYIAQPTVSARDGSRHSSALPADQFEIVDVQGMLYNPVTRRWWLARNQLQCNYIMYARAVSAKKVQLASDM